MNFACLLANTFSIFDSILEEIIFYGGYNKVGDEKTPGERRILELLAGGILLFDCLLILLISEYDFVF